MSSTQRRPQAHGGALRNGGPNRGGGRRKESRLVEAALRLSPLEAVRRLGAIAQGTPLLIIDSGKRRRVSFRSATVKDRIRALEALVSIASADEGPKRMSKLASAAGRKGGAR